MSLAVCAVAFTLVLPAELPDKTAFASLVLGTRHRPLPVFAGVAAAFAVHTCLAVVAGGLLSLLPHRTLDAVSRRCSCSARGYCGAGAETVRRRRRNAPSPRVFCRWRPPASPSSSSPSSVT